MIDISDTIAPKSDQMNCEDLLTGPRVFTIADVRKTGDQQPVAITLAEFPRPWKPSKTVRRLLVAMWGKDASAWVGQKVELFGDPEVVYGGVKVGGIRVSAVSGIEKDFTIALATTKGKRAVFTVKPLAVKPAEVLTPERIAGASLEECRQWWSQASAETQALISARVDELKGVES